MVLLIIIPIKWLFHWEYTLFSDIPIYIYIYPDAPCMLYLPTKLGDFQGKCWYIFQHHGAYGVYIFIQIPMKMDWWPASSPVWVIESILLDHGSHGTGMSVGIPNKYQFNWEKLVLNHRSPSFWYNYYILYIIIIIIIIIINIIIINYHIGI